MVTKYLAVSESVARLHKMNGVAEPIEVIPNFIDSDGTAATVTPREGPILFVGPSEGVKGFNVLRRAHRILIARGRTDSLHHVGGDTIEQEGRTLHSGRLQGEYLLSAYRSARVVVIPSMWEEPCPTVALEAMAGGRAIVASAIGGLVDIVKDGETGVLVPPGDPLILADALQSLLDDENRLERMGAAAATQLASYSVTNVGPKIEAAYVAACQPDRTTG